MILTKPNDALNIVYATDSNGIKLCCASMFSIVRRKNKSTKIKFYILGDRLSSDKEFLKFNTIENVQVKILYLDASQLIHAKAIPERLGSASHLRVMIPSLIAFNALHRVLYIDTDIFGLRDLTDMYWSDLDGYSIGMVKDGSGVVNYNSPDWPNDKYVHKDWFCNTGWILMDLDKLRKTKDHLTWLKLIRDNTNKELNDQHLINSVCHNSVKLFPPTYQLSYHNLIRYDGSVWSIDTWNKYYNTNYSSIEEMVKSSYMWHFHENKFILMRDFPKIKFIINTFINEYEDFNDTGIIRPWNQKSDDKLYIDFKKK